MPSIKQVDDPEGNHALVVYIGPMSCKLPIYLSHGPSIVPHDQYYQYLDPSVVFRGSSLFPGLLASGALLDVRFWLRSCTDLDPDVHSEIHQFLLYFAAVGLPTPDKGHN